MFFNCRSPISVNAAGDSSPNLSPQIRRNIDAAGRRETFQFAARFTAWPVDALGLDDDVSQVRGYAYINTAAVAQPNIARRHDLARQAHNARLSIAKIHSVWTCMLPSPTSSRFWRSP